MVSAMMPTGVQNGIGPDRLHSTESGSHLEDRVLRAQLGAINLPVVEEDSNDLATGDKGFVEDEHIGAVLNRWVALAGEGALRHSSNHTVASPGRGMSFPWRDRRIGVQTDKASCGT